VPVVLLDLGFNQTTGLPNADLPTRAADAVNARCFRAEVILDGPNETGYLARQEACSSDIMSR